MVSLERVQAVITEVPCLPLGKLLADLKLTHVNFFSLDVEGAELSVVEVSIRLLLQRCSHPRPCLDLSRFYSPRHISSSALFVTEHRNI